MKLLNEYLQQYQPEIECELKAILDRYVPAPYLPLRSMLAYHMGWEGEGAGPSAHGKRIRPVMVLLCAQAAGSDWRQALPAAASVEYVHNFSLIHDDIQDQSPLRRGRPTVWTQWGIAQAINAGDLMFTLSHLSILELKDTVSAEIAVRSARLLHETCVELTKGQYLDMANESARSMPIGNYWPMVQGKTAALLACACQLGAIVSGVSEEIELSYREFGLKLGLAFQAWDDWLGIWGKTEITGKSTESDLTSGKKTLPILYGLEQQGEFARRWMDKSISAEEVEEMAGLLAHSGAQEYTEIIADQLTTEALEALNRAKPGGDAGSALGELAAWLLHRKQ
jgi:geranylgeranyl diphosphate synthase type I